MPDDPDILSKAATASRRWAWRALGGISLLLGIIGIFLPVMPTAPFVILAAFAFGRSAPRVAAYLERHPVFGPIILDWRRNGSIALRYKVMAIAMMAASLALGFALSLPLVVIAIQAACMTGAAIFILSRPNAAASAPAPANR